MAFNKKPFNIFYKLNFLLQILIFIFSCHIAFRLEDVNFSLWLKHETKAIGFCLYKSSSWNMSMWITTTATSHRIHIHITTHITEISQNRNNEFIKQVLNKLINKHFFNFYSISFNRNCLNFLIIQIKFNVWQFTYAVNLH